MRRWLASLGACACLLAIPISVIAQVTDGALEGRVLDVDGTPIPDARVTVTGATLQGERSVASNARGAFRFWALPVGLYQVAIGEVAHRPIRLTGVQVTLGAITTLGDLRLERTVIELAPVKVEERRPGVTRTSTTLGTRFSSKTLEALPSDRNFHSFVALVPQAVQTTPGEEPNIAGSTGEGNYYFVDGNDVTSPAGAGSSIALPFNFLQGLEVKTSGYEAEYGRALGGIINAVTPSGGNEFHAETFGYFTNQDFSAKATNPGQPGGDYAVYDAGLRLSGPLRRDRLWYFGAYNPTLDHHDVEALGMGALRDRLTVHRFAGKLTWRASDATDLHLTVLGDPSVRRVVGPPFGLAPATAQVLNPDVFLADVHGGMVQGSLDAVHHPGPDLLFKMALSRVREKSWVEAISDRGRNEPMFMDRTTNTLSGGYGGENRNHFDRSALRTSVTWTRGTHVAKLGFDYTDNSITNDIQGGDGRAHAGFLTRNADSTWFWFQTYQVGTVHVRVPTAYLQDGWNIGERCHLGAGLRWDGVSYVGEDGGTKLRVTDGFQPRLGIVYLPGEIGSQRISTSYGRYFEQLPAGSPGYYFFDASQLFINSDHDPRSDLSGTDSVRLSPILGGVGTLRGQHFDEYTAGYDRALTSSFEVGLHGVVRALREVVEDSYNPARGAYDIGNPGRGDLSYLPRPKALYRALEVTLQRRTDDGSSLFVSYVLSRNSGNYAGLIWGNGGLQFDFPRSFQNADGDLPNDHRHVFKIAATKQLSAGVGAGGVFTWQSGAPLNELGSNPEVWYGPFFLRPRGTVGRTPSLWNLDARFTYKPASHLARFSPRFSLDLFHLLNPGKAVLLDEQHFFATDAAGNQTAPNPNYLKPVLYQPSFSARLGMTIGL